ncbi:MAG: RsmB/NOP family class I SAM-dependent RNA methyltransferase [Hyphomicrobiales bacterium]
MRLGGRIEAAIAVIEEVENNKRPISEALRDWGNAHRFAGSGDRAAIGNLVYDVFRKRRSLAWRMDDESASSLVHAALFDGWDLTPESLAETLKDDKFAPPPISEERIAAFKSRDIKDAPEAVQADLPDWLAEIFEETYEEEWIKEGQAFTKRPSLDVRVNTLKATSEKVANALSKTNAKPTNIARNGLRIEPGRGAKRLPNIQAEEGYKKGWFEIQDEGSQIASDLIYGRAGDQVLDFCAGAGGKTLALSMIMENKGQIHAFDANKQRLAPIYDRINRAGCRNVQVHAPEGEGGVDGLTSLVGRMDRVLVDAPCTGTGTWRRHPESKWKLRPEAVERRVEEQEAVLEEAAQYVKLGGFLVYVTCSILPQENELQLLKFAETNPEFEIVSVGEVWQDLFGFEKPQPWSADLNSITLTPAATNTDGFFIGVLCRAD